MKHIKPYTQLLLEQEAMVDPNAAASTQAEKEFIYVFLEPDEYSKIKKKTYPDGSSTADYPTFSSTEKELTDWTKKNIASTDKNKMSDSELETKRKKLIDVVTGKKSHVADSDLPFLEKLKNASLTDMFGNRKPDTSVFFTKKGEATTHNIEVTFITLRK
jgi:hypothetical protein